MFIKKASALCQWTFWDCSLSSKFICYKMLGVKAVHHGWPSYFASKMRLVRRHSTILVQGLYYLARRIGQRRCFLSFGVVGWACEGSLGFCCTSATLVGHQCHPHASRECCFIEHVRLPFSAKQSALLSRHDIQVPGIYQKGERWLDKLK